MSHHSSRWGSGTCFVYPRVHQRALHTLLGASVTAVLYVVQNTYEIVNLVSVTLHRHLYQSEKIKTWKETKQDSDITCFMNASERKNAEYFARRFGSYVHSICAARKN